MGTLLAHEQVSVSRVCDSDGQERLILDKPLPPESLPSPDSTAPEVRTARVTRLPAVRQ